ncbi:transcription initiation factor IIF, beta subunit-domain-containing protein, partial [Obelidium mucronatum]
WLVKVPKFVKEQWDKVGDKPGVQLGVLRVLVPLTHKTSSKAKAPPITLHLPQNPLPGLADFWTDGVPKNFNLNITNTEVKSSYVFTTNEQQDSVTSFSATVVHEATATPVIDAEYKALGRKRQEEESRKRRNIQHINLRDAKQEMRVGPSKGGEVHDSIVKATANSVAAVTGKLNQQDKRERMERADLIATLITLFNEHAYWKFADLSEKTQQPNAWLKEVLGTCADLVKKGPYNGLYELKPEY